MSHRLWIIVYAGREKELGRQKGADKDALYLPLYDILHTQSTDFVVQDIQEYMANRGVVLGEDIPGGEHH